MDKLKRGGERSGLEHKKQTRIHDTVQWAISRWQGFSEFKGVQIGAKCWRLAIPYVEGLLGEKVEVEGERWHVVAMSNWINSVKKSEALRSLLAWILASAREVHRARNAPASSISPKSFKLGPYDFLAKRGVEKALQAASSTPNRRFWKNWLKQKKKNDNNSKKATATPEQRPQGGKEKAKAQTLRKAARQKCEEIIRTTIFAANDSVAQQRAKICSLQRLQKYLTQFRSEQLALELQPLNEEASRASVAVNQQTTDKGKDKQPVPLDEEALDAKEEAKKEDEEKKKKEEQKQMEEAEEEEGEEVTQGQAKMNKHETEEREAEKEEEARPEMKKREEEMNHQKKSEDQQGGERKEDAKEEEHQKTAEKNMMDQQPKANESSASRKVSVLDPLAMVGSTDQGQMARSADINDILIQGNEVVPPQKTLLEDAAQDSPAPRGRRSPTAQSEASSSSSSWSGASRKRTAGSLAEEATTNSRGAENEPKKAKRMRTHTSKRSNNERQKEKTDEPVEGQEPTSPSATTDDKAPAGSETSEKATKRDYLPILRSLHHDQMLRLAKELSVPKVSPKWDSDRLCRGLNRSLLGLDSARADEQLASVSPHEGSVATKKRKQPFSNGGTKKTATKTNSAQGGAKKQKQNT